MLYRESGYSAALLLGMRAESSRQELIMLLLDLLFLKLAV
jgi:hypothetical protein